jgi:CubicO group peptidase (beta-lactamase class C family)
MVPAVLRHRYLLAALLAALVSLPDILAQESPATSSKAISGALQPLVDNHSLAGAVTLVADKDRILSQNAVGHADIAAGKPMTTDALFWIASQSKPITATALMMLVDEGKLALDDPVEKHLPEFHHQWLAVEQDSNHLLLKQPKRPITIRDILSHTSGLPFASAAEQPTLDLLPLRVGSLTYAMTPLVFEAGSKYQYSNAGINTAGRIIEVKSGMPYEDFLETRLLRPMGMIDTTFWPSAEQLSRLAKSYKPRRNGNGLEEAVITQLKYPLSDRTRQPMPAGGLFSTAHDLARFCQMILNEGVFEGKRYLARAAVAELTRKQTPDSIKEGYGLGWATSGGSFGHGGAYSTNMTIDRDRGLIYVFLVQHAGFPGNGGSSFEAFKKAAAEEFGKKEG